MIKILSLDGGGVYGAISVTILDRIIKNHPTLLDQVDLIAGTSVGGILGLGLACGVTSSQLKEMFITESATMFQKETMRTAAAYAGIKAFYSNSGRKSILAKHMGSKTLGELSKKVMVTAFQLDNPQHQWGFKLFKNYGIDADLTTTAVDAAMITSSSPIFYPSYNSHIDGGLTDNNPALSAIASLIDHKYCGQPEDVVVLSLGTGQDQANYIAGDVDWGWMNWGQKIFPLFLSGDTKTADFHCKQFLKDRYMKINPMLPTNLSGMRDNIKLIPGFIKFAETVDLTEVDKWIKNWWIPNIGS